MKNNAFNRGIKAAEVYQKLSKTARLMNTACLNWAYRRGLPPFVGLLPVPIACLSLLTAAIVSGLIIGCIFLLVAAFIYMLCNISLKDSNGTSQSRSTTGTEWRDGYEGSGIYTGSARAGATSSRIDNYDDEDD